MSKSNRLRTLLANGYFPEELPPPFTTQNFAKFRAVIGTAWAALPQPYPRTSAELYSGPRQHGWRRDFSIVNPIAQYNLAKLVADEWVTIEKSLENSYSAEVLKIGDGGGRAVPKPDFELVRLRHVEITAQYNYVLIADISRFYGTLYTHAIPWALHSRAWCKANLHNVHYKASLGERLDKAVRRGNEDQTLGIPVGPDTSRLLSEIVAVAVDKMLKDKLDLTSDRAVRHVDDWYIGFDTLGEAEAAMAVLASSCRDFQLEIHPEKTRCIHVPRETVPEWPMALRSIRFATKSAQQRSSIEHFFSQAFHYAEIHKKDNVLSYAVSRTRNIKVQPENWHTYETYLLKAARANTTTLPAIVQILTSYNSSGFKLGLDRIGKLITDLVRNGAPMAFHAEVAWALFLAKALAIRLPAAALLPVTELESSACALVALDLRSRNLIDGELDTGLWQQSINEAGLTSSMWLLAYEAELKGWLASANPYVANHPYFGELLKRKVTFYDTKRNVKHIAKSKPKPPSDALLELLAKWSGTVPTQVDGIALQWPDVQLPAGLGPYWDQGDFY